MVKSNLSIQIAKWYIPLDVVAPDCDDVVGSDEDFDFSFREPDFSEVVLV